MASQVRQLTGEELSVQQRRNRWNRAIVLVVLGSIIVGLRALFGVL